MVAWGIPMLLITIAAIVCIGMLFWTDRQKARKLQMRVNKLYASSMFTELGPLLKRAQKYPVEQLIVDKRGVILRYLYPAGQEMHFSLRERGYDPLSPEKQEALLVLMEQFLPKLADTGRYALRKKHTVLLNGSKESYYTYTIRNEYKASLSRAPQYRVGTYSSR